MMSNCVLEQGTARRVFYPSHLQIFSSVLVHLCVSKEGNPRELQYFVCERESGMENKGWDILVTTDIFGRMLRVARKGIGGRREGSGVPL